MCKDCGVKPVDSKGGSRWGTKCHACYCAARLPDVPCEICGDRCRAGGPNGGRCKKHPYTWDSKMKRAPCVSCGAACYASINPVCNKCRREKERVKAPCARCGQTCISTRNGGLCYDCSSLSQVAKAPCIRCGKSCFPDMNAGRCGNCAMMSGGTKRANRNKGKNRHRRYVGTHCERCGFEPEHIAQLEVDHIDGNHANNEPGNLQTLCANCHRLKTMLNGDHLTPVAPVESAPSPQISLL